MASHHTGLTIQIARNLFSSQRLTPSQLALYCHSIATHTEEQFNNHHHHDSGSTNGSTSSIAQCKHKYNSYNAFSNLFPIDEILSQSAQSDQRYKDGIPKSPLDGIPISIKCNIAVEGKDLTACSNILKHVLGYDSHVTRRLKDSGAIIVGLTNMDEFGMGSLGINNNNNKNNSNSKNSNYNYNYNNATMTKNPIRSLTKHPYQYSIEEWVERIESLSMPEHIIESSDGPHGAGEILSPGGSSSGSAVSVAVGSSLASIGTDTGGSVRLPASWCGVVGFKPTYGSISRRGVVSYASSLDTVGILANSVNCASLVFDILKNRDGETLEELGDATSCVVDFNVDELTNDFNKNSSSDGPQQDWLEGMRVGIPEAFSIKECPSEILDAWGRTIDRLEKSGATIHTISEKKISPSSVKMSLPAYYVISCAEASSNLARYDGLKFGESICPNEDMLNKDNNNSNWNLREMRVASTRAKGFGTEVKRRILAGTAVLSSDRFHTFYEAAATVRAAITSELNETFNKDGDCGVDLLLIPTTMTDPPSLDPYSSVPDSTEAFQNDILTTPISLAGLPSISVPVQNSIKRGHPVAGMQLIGPKKAEQKILRAANVLMSCND